MKSLLLLAGIALASVGPCAAQLSTGSSGLHIAAGTTVGVDSLILTPANNLEISNRAISKSFATAPTYVGPSIQRVYTIQPQLSFSGELGLVYDESSLGANDESALVMAYADSFNTSCVLIANSQSDPAGNTVYAQIYTPFNLYRISAVDNPAAPTGIGTVAGLAGLRIWPNPVSDVLHLSLENGMLNELRYQVLNAQGAMVAGGALLPGMEVSLDARSWAAGAYLVRVGDRAVGIVKP